MDMQGVFVPLGFVPLTEIKYTHGKQERPTDVGQVTHRAESLLLIDVNLLATVTTNVHGDRVVSLRPLHQTGHAMSYCVAESVEVIAYRVREMQNSVAQRMAYLSETKKQELELEKEVLLLRKEDAAREAKNK